MNEGYKLVDYWVTNQGERVPRFLVHGMPIGDGRSRIIPRDMWLDIEPGTKGFHFFATMNGLAKYLPRFRKRKADLYAVRIEFQNVIDYGPNYVLAKKFMLSEKNWKERVKGSHIILDTTLKKVLKGWRY